MTKHNRPPQHYSPTRPNRKAKAPYNFVPITDRVIAFAEDDLQLPAEPGANAHPLAVDHTQYDPRKYTGWIDVELETKTPVYVRAPLTGQEFAETEREKEKKTNIDQLRNKPDFFYTANKEQPVIPGSSLRGMIRSLVEIVAHGKLSPVTDSPLIYRAVGDTSSHGDAYRDQLFESDPARKNHFTPRFKGGYMRQIDGEWHIQPVQEMKGTTFARVNHRRIPHNLNRWGRSRNASEIYIAIDEYDFKQVRGGFVHMKRCRVIEASDHDEGGRLKRAVLARSGRIPKKMSEMVVFEPDEEATPIPVPNDAESGEGDMVAAYIDQITPEQKKLLGDDGVLVENQPILYLMNGDRLIFFGHTQMFRIPYRFSPRQMLPPEHRTERLVDLAEAMFGRVKQTGDSEGLQAIAGRIFVEDAITEEKSPWLPGKPVLVPKIMASPKPTTFQHYLTQPRPDVDQGKGLETYNSSPRRTTLRGHKLYWHKGDVQRKDYEAKDEDIKGKESQYTRMKPVRPGTRFTFRIRFENLAAVELGALWWAIALPTNGDYYHKIGMGKPLGLGAVKLKPALFVNDPQVRYRQLFDQTQFHLGTVDKTTAQEVAQSATKLFERFVCKQLGYKDFVGSERIQQLLTMLQWPGPDTEETRYMEIEYPDPTSKRGKRNEYRGRPVLPKPDSVEE